MKDRNEIYKINPINCIRRDQSNHVSFIFPTHNDDNFTDFTAYVKEIIYENVIMELNESQTRTGYKLSI